MDMTQPQTMHKEFRQSLKVKQLAFPDLTTPQKRWLMDQTDYSGTIVVNPNMSAADMVRKVAQAGAGLVVVVGDRDDVEGVLVPDDLVKQFQNKYDVVGSDLTAILDELSEKHPKLKDAERIVFERPGLYWCAEGRHYTSSIPCPQKHQ